MGLRLAAGGEAAAVRAELHPRAGALPVGVLEALGEDGAGVLPGRPHHQAPPVAESGVAAVGREDGAGGLGHDVAARPVEQPDAPVAGVEQHVALVGDPGRRQLPVGGFPGELPVLGPQQARPAVLLADQQVLPARAEADLPGVAQVELVGGQLHQRAPGPFGPLARLPHLHAQRRVRDEPPPVGRQQPAGLVAGVQRAQRQYPALQLEGRRVERAAGLGELGDPPGGEAQQHRGRRVGAAQALRGLGDRAGGGLGAAQLGLLVLGPGDAAGQQGEHAHAGQS
ncbi:hypothetical protein ACH5AU_29255 [Streptomyces albidoflavus]